MPNKLAIAKSAIKFVVAAGVSRVVRDVLDANTDPQSTTDEVLNYTGGAVIGWMVQDAASKHIDSKVDEIADWYRNLKDTSEDVCES